MHTKQIPSILQFCAFFILSEAIFILTGATGFAEPAAKSLYEISAKTAEGEQLNLNRYKNHVTVVVNTASYCGYTSQYKALQSIYEKYKKQNFTVLAFPSNDFKQEPAENAEIKKFCERKYAVTFPVFEKGRVRGEEKQPVYRFLSSKDDVSWNFEKFLVNRAGQVVGRFSSQVKPDSPEMTQKIEQLLAERI